MRRLIPLLLLAVSVGALAQDPARGRSKGMSCLDDLTIDTADPELGEANPGSKREDHGSDDAGHNADPEQHGPGGATMVGRGEQELVDALDARSLRAIE